MTYRLRMNAKNIVTHRRRYSRCVSLPLALLFASGALCAAMTCPVRAQDKPSSAGKKDGKDAQADAKSAKKPGGKSAKDQDGKGAASDTQGKDKPKAKQDNQEAADTQEDLINADRPGIADGSQVIGPRRFQIEVGVEEDFTGGGKTPSRLLTVPTLLRFGIDERYEFRVETLGYTDLSASDPQFGVTHAQGTSPISFGFKRQFQTSKGPRHPSIGTIFRLFPGSGSGVFASNHATGDLRLAADWDFAPKLSLNPNIGVGVYENDAGRTYGTGLLATTLTYAPTTRLGVFIDYGLQTKEVTGERASLVYDGGVTYILGTNIQLDVAVGTGALGRTTPHPFWTTGVSVRF